jgi:hypothetical protein
VDRRGLLRPLGLVAWLALSLAGFVAGFLLVFQGGWFLVEALTGDADRLFDGDGGFFWVSLTAGFVLGGVGMAAGQWLLLRRHVEVGARRWIAGWALGLGTLTLLYLALHGLVPPTASEFVHNLAGGLVIGALHLPVLRRLTSRAPRWPCQPARRCRRCSSTASGTAGSRGRSSAWCSSP